MHAQRKHDDRGHPATLGPVCGEYNIFRDTLLTNTVSQFIATMVNSLGNALMAKLATWTCSACGAGNDYAEDWYCSCCWKPRDEADEIEEGDEDE